MHKLPSFLRFGSRWVCLALAPLFVCLNLAEPASSQTTNIVQNASYNEPGPPYLPQFDDMGFDNESVFTVTYNIYQNNQIEFCEPWWGTLFYTNNGEMILNAPFPTNGDFNTQTTGVGYKFDLQEGNSNVMAGTFYNPGTIHCDSVLDGNNVSIFNFGGLQFFIGLTSIGDCFVSATNIINPGNIEIGIGGQLNLNGQNVDLSRGVLTLEQGLMNSNNVDASVNSEGEGYNTNGYVPSYDLTATNAYASYPDNLYLSYPTSYFGEVQRDPSNVLVRAVFIVNANSNVSDTVYIAPSAFDNEGALIQWAGTYPDPVTGLTDTNYLYLYHYYFGSFGLTNLFPVVTVGTPAQPGFLGFFNYLWSQNTSYPGLSNPTAPGFQNIFNDTVITNVYEYFNASLSGTTISTNANVQNPSGALTNLPNRLVINASRELKMDLAQISGQNYMSLTASNQFDGSPGALIYSPYSDISLGVTNGYPGLTISNLLVSDIPEWGGTLNEWSGRWTNTDSSGVNWDYRVMLVYANLTPVMTPQVQNLTLSATNLIISDALNVFGSMYANAQSLTLTTNGLGSGATSPDGELNMQLESPATWSWNASFPYLSVLTNNGAIRMPNWASFISQAAAPDAVPTIPAVAATNILFEDGGPNAIKGSGVSIGGISYTFTNAVNRGSAANFVLIGRSFDGSLSNLIAAINGGAGGGSLYGTNGFYFRNSAASAGLLQTSLPVPGITNHGFIVSATIPGVTPGNDIVTSTTATNLFWTNSASGITLTGGVNAIPGYTNFVYGPSYYAAIANNGLMSDQGSTIWASNFLSGGVISNGVGSFLLTSWNTALTNGSISAGGDVSLAANTLVTSNLMLQAGRSLTLLITNSFTDCSVSNGNIWLVGVSNVIGFSQLGLDLPLLPGNTDNLPASNNLLGTTIYLQVPPPNKQLSNYWAGLDYGGTNAAGYNTNNMAIGQLILNSPSQNSSFSFSGPAGSTKNNAIYVDRLVLENYAGLGYPNWQGLGGPPTLVFNNNPNAGYLTIYYADAISSEYDNGGPFLDVSYILNGLDGGHLVWVPEYTGYFSSTNFNSNGVIRTVNLGMVENSRPEVVASRVNLKVATVNVPAKTLNLAWESYPGATNAVYYSTNLLGSDWLMLTNFVSPTNLPPAIVWPITDVVQEPFNLTAPSAYYRVMVTPNAASP